MQKRRERFIEAVIGQRASGKTTQIKKDIEAYDGKVLILDSNDEYTEYPKIHHTEIAQFAKTDSFYSKMHGKGSIVRVVCSSVRDCNSLHHFTNGLLVIESGAIAGDRNMMSIVVCSRTKRIDVIITYQDLSLMPPIILQNAEFFRIHQSTDIIPHPRYKDRYPSSMIPLLADVSFLLRKHKKHDRFAFYTIDLRNNAILGMSRWRIEWLRFKHRIFDFLNGLILPICEFKRAIKAKMQ